MPDPAQAFWVAEAALTALAALFVSVASLFVSALTYRRDQSNVHVKLKLYQIRTSEISWVNAGTAERPTVSVSLPGLIVITNNGRRPVSITNIDVALPTGRFLPVRVQGALKLAESDVFAVEIVKR